MSRSPGRWRKFTGDVLETRARAAPEPRRRRLLGAIDGETSCVVVQYPDILGRIADLSELAGALPREGALLIAVVTEPVALGAISRRARWARTSSSAKASRSASASISAGPMSACSPAGEVRPADAGPAAGETVDAEGKRGFVLTLRPASSISAARRRPRTSAPARCSARSPSRSHMTLLGEKGLRQLAAINHRRREAAPTARPVPGVELVNDSFFNEFTLQLPKEARPVVRTMADKACSAESRSAGSIRAADARQRPGRRGDRDRDRRGCRALANGARGGAGMSMNQRRRADRARRPRSPAGHLHRQPRADARGACCFEIGDTDRPASISRCDGAPGESRPRLSARSPIGLAGLSEPETVRHYTRLSRRIMRSTSACSRSALHDEAQSALKREVARMPGFADIHPLQPIDTVQGALELIDRLASGWSTLTGMHSVAMSPKAEPWRIVRTARDPLGARGAGRRARGHPRPRKRPRHQSGEPRLRRLSGREHPGHVARPGRSRRAEVAARPDVARVMITNPNTCGLFEPDMIEISRAGPLRPAAWSIATGANFNAIVGRVRPGDLGIDAMHINLHKTFSTPHGGGGPGSGRWSSPRR
jgi:glycine cleavage system pyridoxal-binding protein P